METRERLDLRSNLAMWNLLLCVFSLCGAFRTVPHLLYNVSTMSLTETMTTPSVNDWGSGAGVGELLSLDFEQPDSLKHSNTHGL